MEKFWNLLRAETGNVVYYFLQYCIGQNSVIWSYWMQETRIYTILCLEKVRSMVETKRVVFMTGFQHIAWNLESWTLICRHHPIRREVLPGSSNSSQPLSSAPEASAPVDSTTKAWIAFSYLANRRYLNTFYVPSYMLVTKEKPVTKRSDGRGCNSECPC